MSYRIISGPSVAVLQQNLFPADPTAEQGELTFMVVWSVEMPDQARPFKLSIYDVLLRELDDNKPNPDAAFISFMAVDTARPEYWYQGFYNPYTGEGELLEIS